MFNTVKAGLAVKFWLVGFISLLVSFVIFESVEPFGLFAALVVSAAFFSAVTLLVGYILAAVTIWPFRMAVEGRVDDEPFPIEVREVQQAVDALKARMDEAVLSQKRFLADASHEMRSPITVMKGDIEIALRRERGVSEYKEILASNLEEIDRLEYLLKDLMFLARTDANELVMNIAPMRLSDVVELVCAGMGRLAGTKGVALKADVKSRDESVMEGDADRIRQLLVNLVDNAVKYTPAGGSVRVALDYIAGVNRLTVSDTGIGIPKDELGRIFDRFYRVDKARSRESGGTGLGLCICKWIVEAHGGEITIESAEGRGTDVTVMFLSTSASKPS